MGSANARNPFLFASETSLGRQGSSVYSLTFDEFQNALGEPGKDFGSMNMEELLKNIWTAEESQAMAAAMSSLDGPGAGLATQVSLAKQGSLTLPRTLSTKTVEEVWRNIQQDGTGNAGTGAGQPRQLTFGEMTLEDFLVKAGVVREEVVPASEAFISFGGNSGFVGDANGGGDRVESRRVLGASDGDRSMFEHAAVGPQLKVSAPNMLSGPPLMDEMQFDGLQNISSPTQQGDWIRNQYRNTMTQQQQQQQQLMQRPGAIEAASAYANATKGAANGHVMGNKIGTSPGRLSPPFEGGLGAVLGNVGLGGLGGGRGFNGLGYGAGSPLSPTSDGAGSSHGNLPLSLVAQYGFNGQLQGRKRCAEGPVEKVIERRQRRMIKNRESAARSRARKQAYTVELEAEVTQLKEENLKLLRNQEEEAEQRKKQILAVMPPSVRNMGNKGWALRRTCTGPW